MKVVITGGAGFVGSKLAGALLERGTLTNQAGTEVQIEKLVIFDQVVADHLPQDDRLEIVVGQANDPEALNQVLAGADSVFHFASVVSGGAEADLQLGLAVNLDGTRMLLDILADSGRHPKLIFASSLAVYGGGAEIVTDETATHPQSSYGVQKLCCELLVGDYARRGLVDGRAIRFPTIAIRPGNPNLAKSSYISNIVREPVAGKTTVCPVPADTDIALMSPGRLISAIIRVHNLDGAALGWPRSLLLPAVRVSVTEMLDALEAEVGPEARSLVSFEPDVETTAIVKSWPAMTVGARAEALGIHTDNDAGEIVRDFLETTGGTES